MKKPSIPSKLVEVTPLQPEYGTVIVNVDHIIAMSANESGKHEIYFECVMWRLTPEDFERVRNSWILNSVGDFENEK